MPAAAGVGVLGVTLGGVLLLREDDRGPEPQRAIAPSPEPAAGFVTIEIKTRPGGAKVVRIDDGPERLLQGTPAKLELRGGKPITVAIRKPGYLTVRRELVPTAHAVIDLELQPVNAFEGVWAMSDGQLRELLRNGDQVDVYKRKSVTGSRELWKKFAFAESAIDDEVTFAAQAEMIADGGSPDPSCRLTHKIEYHYHLANQTLDVQAERIETGKRVDGGCFVVRSEPGQRKRLVRADHATETSWTEPPVGRPAETSVKRDVKERTVGKPRPKRAAPTQNAPPQLKPEIGNQEAPPPPPQQQAAPKGDSQIAPPEPQKK